MQIEIKIDETLSEPRIITVSYTHLDVYKRQKLQWPVFSVLKYEFS